MELIKIIIDACIPIIVLFFGWQINKKLKKLEYSQWTNQKVIEKRLVLYDEINPKLNDLYCFYLFIGNWKDIKPTDVIEIKRFIDKKINVYKSILGEKLYKEINEFLKLSFQTYSGEGKDSLIKSVIDGFDGDRRIHSNYNWIHSYDNLFVKNVAFNKTEYCESYEKVEIAFQQIIGISNDIKI